MSNPIVTKMNIAIGFSVQPEGNPVRVTSLPVEVLGSVAAGIDNLVAVTQAAVEVLVTADPAKTPSVTLIQHGWNPNLDIPPELTTDLQP